VKITKNIIATTTTLLNSHFTLLTSDRTTNALIPYVLKLLKMIISANTAQDIENYCYLTEN